MELELRHLRAICGIADAGSLSQAGANLGMSQPSLTRLLQRFERRIGSELFSRGPAGVVPTSVGAELIRRARILLLEFDELSLDVTRARPQHVLRMGTSQLQYVNTLADRLDEVLPGWEISLRIESSSVLLVQALAQGQLDAAAIGMSEEQEIQLPPHVAHRTVAAGIPAYIGLSDSHPLAARPEVKLADLAGDSWISPPGSEDGSLASLRAATRRAGFLPRIRYECQSGGGRQLIASGRAVQLVDPTTTPVPGMTVRPLVDDPILLKLVLAWRRDRIDRSHADLLHQATTTAYETHALASPAFHDRWLERTNG